MLLLLLLLLPRLDTGYRCYYLRYCCCRCCYRYCCNPLSQKLILFLMDAARLSMPRRAGLAPMLPGSLRRSCFISLPHLLILRCSWPSSCAEPSIGLLIKGIHTCVLHSSDRRLPITLPILQRL
uniref:Secreted protein n=1 Tax=Knipowitschia caucasica TaxID=637954 RepID=A0AAV2L4F8_KNICA